MDRAQLETLCRQLLQPEMVPSQISISTQIQAPKLTSQTPNPPILLPRTPNSSILLPSRNLIVPSVNRNITKIQIPKGSDF